MKITYTRTTTYSDNFFGTIQSLARRIPSLGNNPDCPLEQEARNQIAWHLGQAMKLAVELTTFQLPNKH